MGKKEVWKILLLVFALNLIGCAFGEQKTIVSFYSDGRVSFNEEALKKLLSNPQVADRKIVVYTIAGDQQGKSFMMNYALRFMHANVRKFQHFDKNFIIFQFLSTTQ